MGRPGPWWDRRQAGPTRTVHPLAAAAAAAVLVAHVVPAIAVLPGVRLRFLPALSGIGAPGHVALTFDDGPDPASTPKFIDTLATHGVKATFFVLGSMLARHPWLGSDLAASGHEVGVHGWEHRNLLLRGPVATWRDLARTRDLVAAVTGRTPTFFRPPYGVLSGAALMAARRLGLTPVLWTCWGRDWTRQADRRSVLETVRARLAGGGTILLHDSDCTSAPGSWRSTLAALPELLDHCADQGWRVGPLGGHGLAAADRPPPDGPGRRSP